MIKRKYAIILFILCFLSIEINSKDNSVLSINPIFSRLTNLQPSLDYDLAMSISAEIYKCHKSIDIDPYLLTAIYNQESKMNYKAKNCLKGVIEKNSLDDIIVLVKKNIESDIDEEKLKKDLLNIPINFCFVLGIGQITVSTALNNYQCTDLKRLTTDYRYNIACSCKVLEGFKNKYGYKEKFWWTRYNSSNNVKREIYRKLVMQYYPNKNISTQEEIAYDYIPYFEKKIH